VDVHEILRDVASIVRAETAQKHIFLTLYFNATRCQIFGDPVRLKQIFSNVLKNTAKFTADNGQITVETDTTASHRLVVKISDTGIGTDGNETRTVLDQFSQGSHGTAGLGLGLAITRNLVTLQSGNIYVSGPGGGKAVMFLIDFPQVKIAEEKDATSATVMGMPKSMNGSRPKKSLSDKKQFKSRTSALK
jgi:signal transduction histidine kinase